MYELRRHVHGGSGEKAFRAPLLGQKRFHVASQRLIVAARLMQERPAFFLGAPEHVVVEA